MYIFSFSSLLVSSLVLQAAAYHLHWLQDRDISLAATQSPPDYPHPQPQTTPSATIMTGPVPSGGVSCTERDISHVTSASGSPPPNYPATTGTMLTGNSISSSLSVASSLSSMPTSSILSGSFMSTIRSTSCYTSTTTLLTGIPPSTLPSGNPPTIASPGVPTTAAPPSSPGLSSTTSGTQVSSPSSTESTACDCISTAYESTASTGTGSQTSPPESLSSGIYPSGSNHPSNESSTNETPGATTSVPGPSGTDVPTSGTHVASATHSTTGPIASSTGAASKDVAPFFAVGMAFALVSMISP